MRGAIETQENGVGAAVATFSRTRAFSKSGGRSAARPSEVYYTESWVGAPRPKRSGWARDARDGVYQYAILGVSCREGA